MDEIAVVIFQDGNNTKNAKNMHNYLRVWFRIILGCVHHIPSTNSFDYINTDQKYVLFYIASRVKLNLPSILFNYLTELVKETRDGGAKLRKWIPMGIAIFDILIERKLFNTLDLPKKLVTDIGKNLDGKNFKNMTLISDVTNIPETLNRNAISSRRIALVDYPDFNKMDSLESPNSGHIPAVVNQ